MNLILVPGFWLGAWSWDVFRVDGARDLDDFRARAVPHPAGAAKDPQVLKDERRFEVPVTLISTTYTREEIDGAIAASLPYFAEIPRLRDVTIVESPTSHWPQFTKPDELASLILAQL